MIPGTSSMLFSLFGVDAKGGEVALLGCLGNLHGQGQACYLFVFPYAWLLCLSFGYLEQFAFGTLVCNTIAGEPLVLFSYVCYAVHLFSYLCDCSVYCCYMCMGTSNFESRLERRNTEIPSKGMIPFYPPWLYLLPIFSV